MEENADGGEVVFDSFLGNQSDSDVSEKQEVVEPTEETPVEEVSEEATEEPTSETPVDEATEEAETAEDKPEEATQESDFVDLTPNEEPSEEPSEEAAAEEEPESTVGTDFSEILNGQFEDEDDVLGYIQDLESKNEELEGKTPKFANEMVEKLNQHVLNGGSASDFIKVQSIDTANMSNLDVLTAELKMSNPNIPTDKLREHVIKKYDLDVDEIDDDNVSLSMDANEARKSIEDKKAQDTLVPQDDSKLSEESWNEKQESVRQEAVDSRVATDTSRMEKWMKPVEDEVESLKKNGLVIPLSDSKGFRFAFDKDDAYTEELIGKVDQALYNAGTTIEESPKMAKQMIELQFKMDNFDEIVKSAGVKMANSANEEWFKEIHNPSAISRGNEKPKQGDELKPLEDQMMNV